MKLSGDICSMKLSVIDLYTLKFYCCGLFDESSNWVPARLAVKLMLMRLFEIFSNCFKL